MKTNLEIEYFVQPRPVILLLYIELFNSFLIGRKHAVNFQNQHPDVITADFTIIMSRTLKVMANHVMYDRRA